MKFRPEADETAALRGLTGNLVLVRARVDSRLLEDLLETLADADFPINPQIRHGFPETTVEFPAYDNQIEEIRSLILHAGLRRVELQTANMLYAIA